MIHIPVSERELEENYDEIMPVIDELSLQRRNIIWETWPEFVKCAGTWKCLKNFHVVMFGGLFEFAGMIRKKISQRGALDSLMHCSLRKLFP